MGRGGHRQGARGRCGGERVCRNMELRNVSKVGQLIADAAGRLIFVPPGELLSLPPDKASALLARSPGDWAPTTQPDGAPTER